LGLEPARLVADLLDLLAVRPDLPGDDPRRARAVGDLLHELVALAEHLAGDPHDVVGMAVVLGVDQRLRHLAAPGKISVGSLSRNVSSTVRIWSSATTSRSRARAS